MFVDKANLEMNFDTCHTKYVSIFRTSMTEAALERPTLKNSLKLIPKQARMNICARCQFNIVLRKVSESDLFSLTKISIKSIPFPCSKFSFKFFLDTF